LGAISGLSVPLEDASFGGIWRIFISVPFQGGVELGGVCGFGGGVYIWEVPPIWWLNCYYLNIPIYFMVGG